MSKTTFSLVVEAVFSFVSFFLGDVPTDTLTRIKHAMSVHVTKLVHLTSFA